ncbi:MAG: hypothetical protein R3275_01240 [Saprospiraceae bacterium]|nr:hypothetical protein [Saprospiraceae bacterium]
MRTQFIAALSCLFLTVACYEDPDSLYHSPPEIRSCQLPIGEGYDIRVPCDTEIVLFANEDDPGVGIIKTSDYEMYYRCDDDLFSSFREIDTSDALERVYYSSWLNGRLMFLIDDRYVTPVLFVYVIDDVNDMKFEFWTREIHKEDAILSALTNMTRG